MRIANVEIGTPVMNAACNVAKSPEDVERFATTKAGAITVGSITPLERLGNQGTVWHEEIGYVLNTYGMPNGGAEYYARHLPSMIELAHTADKALILSGAGFSVEDYRLLAAMADTVRPDVFELNFGCPNIAIDGQQKPIASFDTAYMADILSAVRHETDLPLTVKLSPYSNPAELTKVANMLFALQNSVGVAGVVTSNTFANGYVSDAEGQQVLSDANKGYGGVSGPALRPIALGQVRQFREKLPESMAVIGAGGIETIFDADQFFAAGADAVSAATLVASVNHEAIDRLVA